MKPYHRSQRVGELIHEVLSDTLLRAVKDPRLNGVVITHVKMTSDLKQAMIFFVTSSGSKSSRESAETGFSKARGFLKSALARELDLRYMPELLFRYDDSIEYGFRIDALLKRLKPNGQDNTETE